MLKFSEIRAAVQRNVGDTSTAGQTMIDSDINEAIQMLLDDRRWMFMRSFDVRQTLPSVDSGTGVTLTVTQGSPTVTASAATFTLAYEGGVIAIYNATDDDTTYHRIYRVVSTTEIELEYRYAGSDDTSSTCTYYQDTYPLPWDYESMMKDSVKAPGSSNIILPISRDKLDLLWADDPSVGSQATYYIDDVYRKRDLWSTGTIGLTQNSDAAVGTSSDWENALLAADTAGAALEGHTIRIVSSNNPGLNGVRNVTGATAMNLELPYTASTESGLSYVIGPAFERCFQIWPLPDERETITFGYHKLYEPLIGTNQFTPIPNRHLYVVSSLASALFMQRTALDQEQIIYADRLLKRAMQYGLPRMRRQDWPTAGESQVYRLRKYGIKLDDFAPPVFQLWDKRFEVISAAS